MDCDNICVYGLKGQYIMVDFSLFYPMGYERSPLKMSDDAINDLSLDYIVTTLTEDAFEQNSIKQLMTQIECNAELIKYRCF